MPNDNSTMGERKDIRKDIEAILGECVGEDITVPCPKEVDCPLCERGLQRKCQTAEHNQDLNDLKDDIRNRIPETARKVLERVEEEVESRIDMLISVSIMDRKTATTNAQKFIHDGEVCGYKKAKAVIASLTEKINKERDVK